MNEIKMATIPWSAMDQYFGKTSRWNKDDFMHYIKWADLNNLEPVVLSPQENERFSKFGIDIYPIDDKKDFVNKCKELSVDFVYTFKCDQQVETGIDMAAFAKEKLNIPLFAMAFNTQRDGPIPDSLHQADHIVGISRAVTRYLKEQGIAQNKITYLPIGRDSSEFKPSEANTLYDQTTLLSVGCNASKRKNVSNMVKAVKIAQSHYDFNWIIVGRMGKQLKQRGELEEIDNVEVKGVISRDNLIKEYQKAHFLFNPSKWEGQGLVFAESLLCGTPVITSNVPPMNDIVDNHGILVDPSDPQDIAVGIQGAEQFYNKSTVNNCRDRGVEWSWGKIENRRKEILKKFISDYVE